MTADLQAPRKLDSAEAMALAACLSPRVRTEYRMTQEMFLSDEGRRLAYDIWAGKPRWDDTCQAGVAGWTELLQLRAVTGHDQRVEYGVMVVKRRADKTAKARELREQITRLMDDADPCSDLVAGSEAVRLLDAADMGRIAHERYTRTPQFTTPWASVTPMLAFAGPGDAYLIVGSSSAGKTAFAFQLTRDKRTLYFGVDMTTAAVAKRFFEMHFYAGQSGPLETLSDLRRRCAAAWHAVKQSPEDIARYIPKDFRTIDADQVSLEQIEWTTRDAIRSGFVPQAVVIDYLGRITTEKTFDQEWRADRFVAQQLKRMAKRCGVLVLTLAQFNGQEREYTKPSLSWIAGSKEIRPAVDGILGLWRDRMTDSNGHATADPGHVWITDDLKSRDAGCTGDVRLECRGLHFFDMPAPAENSEW